MVCPQRNPHQPLSSPGSTAGRDIPRPTLGTTAPQSLSLLGHTDQPWGAAAPHYASSCRCGAVRSGQAPTPLTSLGSREMKSRWNWGSMTCIMYLICAGSQRSMSSSRASSFSGPLQRCRGTPSDPWLCVPSQPSHSPGSQGSCPRPGARGRWELGASQEVDHRCCVTGDHPWPGLKPPLCFLTQAKLPKIHRGPNSCP
uniref:Uncharacterized protein n=1 Tax=Corvus moneduloides TaxID=1196302 RepID=A0A8C3DVH5_CORMO